MSDQLNARENANELGLTTLDDGPTDLEVPDQTESWTRETAISQDMSTPALDSLLPEDLSDVDFLELSALWSDAAQPKVGLPSSSHSNYIGRHVDPSPFIGTGCDPFWGVEADTWSPTEAGPSTAQLDLVQSRPEIIPSPPTLSRNSFPDLTSAENSNVDPWPSLDGTTSNVVVPTGDLIKDLSSDTSSALVTGTTLLKSQSRNSTTPLRSEQELDQLASHESESSVNRREYQPILPKAVLAAGDISSSMQHQLIKGKQPAATSRLISPQLPLSVPNQATARVTKRKRSLPEQMIISGSVPCSQLHTFPVSSESANPERGQNYPNPTQRKRAKKGQRKCLRCYMLKEKCDGKSPCSTCQKVWSGKKIKNIHWKKCIDQDIRELNVFAMAFETTCAILKFSKVPENMMARFNQSMLEACDAIIAIVQQSPLEAQISRDIAENIFAHLYPDTEQTLPKTPWFSRLWRPRKTLREYRQITCHPALRFITLILQCDNIMSLMGVRGLEDLGLWAAAFWSCAEFYKAIFASLWQELKKLRPNDALSAKTRDLLIFWLSLLRYTARRDICFGLTWQSLVILIAHASGDALREMEPELLKETYTPELHLRVIIAEALRGVRDAMSLPFAEELFNKLHEAREHLRRYCDYWLDKLAPGMPSFIFDVFPNILKRLTLDNVIDISSDVDGYPRQESRRFNDFCQTVGRFGLVYNDWEFIPSLKLHAMNGYGDVRESPSSSDLSISSEEVHDIAKTITEEIIRELGSVGIKGMDPELRGSLKLYVESEWKAWKLL